MKWSRDIWRWCWSAAVAALTVGAPVAAAAQDAAAYFRQNYVSCHTIGGGRLTGPDLKDVTARRDHAWLLRYIPNPKAMIDGGDPVATQLFQEARGVLMPSPPGLSPGMVDALVSLFEAESKLEKSQFVGLQISDRPFTPQDVARGRAIVRGEVAQARGGALSSGVAGHSGRSGHRHAPVCRARAARRRPPGQRARAVRSGRAGSAPGAPCAESLWTASLPSQGHIERPSRGALGARPRETAPCRAGDLPHLVETFGTTPACNRMSR